MVEKSIEQIVKELASRLRGTIVDRAFLSSDMDYNIRLRIAWLLAHAKTEEHYFAMLEYLQRGYLHGKKGKGGIVGIR